MFGHRGWHHHLDDRGSRRGRTEFGRHVMHSSSSLHPPLNMHMHGNEFDLLRSVLRTLHKTVDRDLALSPDVVDQAARDLEGRGGGSAGKKHDAAKR